MRVTAEHLRALTNAITPYDTPERRARYREHELSDTRYRWDLFWLVDGMTLTADENYADAHIDTALRKIVPTLSVDAGDGWGYELDPE